MAVQATLAPPQCSDLHLRDYQEEALKAVDGAWQEGRRRQLLIAPTGSGKTILFGSLIARRGGRAVVIAHRDELIKQAVDKLRWIDPSLDVGICKGSRNDLHHQVVVASIQSLVRGGRIERLLRHGPLTTVVVDEAHHSSSSYARALQELGCLEDEGPLLLGVTATPNTKDRQLATLYGEVVWERDIGWMIERGYLADLRAVRVKVGIDLNLVKSSSGDFEAGALGAALEDAKAPSIAVEAYEQYAAGRKALVFTPTVKLAHQMAQVFRASGHRAEAVDGTTPSEERAAILGRFQAGETQIVANCAVLTEGFDEPSVSCILMCRPTRSRALWLQCLGRGLRSYPGKDDCLVIDLAGASKRHSIYGIGEAFDLPDPEALRTTSLRTYRAEQRQAQQIEEATREHLTIVGEVVEIAAKFHWVPLNRGRGGFACSIGSGRTMVLLEDGQREWHVGVLRAGAPHRRLAGPLSVEYAQGFAEDHAREAGAARLSGREAGWRARSVSSSASSRARRLGIEVSAGATAGEVSDAITCAEATAMLRPNGVGR